jgi:hypothetical protein
LPEKDNVDLSIYDILGRQVEVLIDGYQSGGSHTINYTPRHLSNGVYFCRLKTNNYDRIQKIIFMK